METREAPKERIGVGLSNSCLRVPVDQRFGKSGYPRPSFRYHVATKRFLGGTAKISAGIELSLRGAVGWGIEVDDK